MSLARLSGLAETHALAWKKKKVNRLFLVLTVAGGGAWRVKKYTQRCDLKPTGGVSNARQNCKQREKLFLANLGVFIKLSIIINYYHE